MANKISEQLFEAVDVLIGKRILDSAKDKTILCTIEDNSKATDGEYTVSNASARFTAYSENTKYRKGQNVWVLIPDGDYNNDKLIVSKYTKDSSTPYVYIDPMDTFIDMTDNVLLEDETATETGLLANCDYPISILSTGDNEYRALQDSFGETRLRLPGGYFDDTPPAAIVLAATANGKATTEIAPVPNSELITPDESKTHILNGVDITGYDKIGIQADFKTAFGTETPISGSYGLCFVIKTEKEVVSETEVTTEQRIYNVLLDSSQMWGNPYSYFDYFTQSTVIEFNQEELGYPISIDCYFYQNFDFIGEDGQPLLYYTTTGVDEEGNAIIHFENGQPVDGDYLDPNISVKNIRVSFGYSVDEITTETLRLYTTSAKMYSSGSTYSKKLKLRYIYVTDDQKKIVINGTSQFIDYLKQISEFAGRYPIIRWYRENDGSQDADMRRGSEWNEILAINNIFDYTAENLIDDIEESFQCVLYSNIEAPYYLYNLWNALSESGNTSELFAFCNVWKQLYDQVYPDLDVENFLNNFEDIWRDTILPDVIQILEDRGDEATDANIEQLIEEIKTNYTLYPELQKATFLQSAWAESDLDGLVSNILIFNNKDDVNDISDAKARGLTLTSGDSSRGVFNYYEATFAADNNLINSADEFIPRKINAAFNSKIIGDTGLMGADRLAWYIPKNNTMIHAPANGKTYNGTRTENNQTIMLPQYCFTKQADIEAYRNNLSDEEYKLFSQRIRDYYIVLEDWTAEGHPRPSENLASLIFYIKPKLIKQWTNNTILASMYRNQQIYEGDNAKITLTFSVKGANGTNYTLVLQMTDEMVGVLDADPSTWTLKNAPSAWTYNYDSASDQNTCAMRLSVALYDANDRLIPNALFEWEVLYDNELFNTSLIRNEVLNGEIGPWLYMSSIRPTAQESDKCYGIILKCTASVSLEEQFDGYLIIPLRNSRDIEALQGASMIRYDSAGVNPQYYTGAYGFVDINGNIDYNIIAEMKIPANRDADPANPDAPVNVIKQYFPEVVAKAGKYYLKAQTMYFNNVDYDCHVKVSKELDENNTLMWAQPLLILVDPYGNSFLNSWNGDLIVDKANNRIMASVIGAGKKEDDNTFTGLLLGNLPEVEDTGKTGLLGYEHGEQSYGLLDDGTLFLGKASTAQIKFDGTTGMLQNSAFGNGGPGLKMSFTGDNEINGPYLVMSQDGNMANTTSTTAIRIATASPYFQIWTPKTDSSGNTITGTSTAIVHIGDGGYYFQTSNYAAGTASTVTATTTNGGFQILDGQNGTLSYATIGAKFDLKDGSLTANNFELLTTKGNYANGFIRISAKANTYPLNINNKFTVDWQGNINATAGKIGNMEISGGKVTKMIVDDTTFTMTNLGFVTNLSGYYTTTQVQVGSNITVTTTPTTTHRTIGIQHWSATPPAVPHTEVSAGYIYMETREYDEVTGYNTNRDVEPVYGSAVNTIYLTMTKYNTQIFAAENATTEEISVLRRT